MLNKHGYHGNVTKTDSILRLDRWPIINRTRYMELLPCLRNLSPTSAEFSPPEPVLPWTDLSTRVAGCAALSGRGLSHNSTRPPSAPRQTPRGGRFFTAPAPAAPAHSGWPCCGPHCRTRHEVRRARRQLITDSPTTAGCRARQVKGPRPSAKWTGTVF